MYIDSLILEVTERCNLACDHCLRGCARNIDLQKETVSSMLSQVNSIGAVVFTGGEPCLNLPIIKYTFDQIRKRKISLGEFWLATNGLVKSYDLAALLLKNIDLCNEPDMCGVAISVDEFHGQIKDKKNPLRFLSFYDKSREMKDWKPEYILNMGRAEETGVGFREFQPETKFYISDEWGDELGVETVYVRANGDLLADCDMSYDFMDKNAICRVEDFTSYVKALHKQESQE